VPGLLLGTIGGAVGRLVGSGFSRIGPREDGPHG
jgi:hypothetical protein